MSTEFDQIRSTFDHFSAVWKTNDAAEGSVLLVVHLAALMRREGDTWRFVDSRPYAFAAVPG